MGPEYPMTRGFQHDKAQLFQRLDRLASAMERIATQMEANEDMRQAQADARESSWQDLAQSNGGEWTTEERERAEEWLANTSMPADVRAILSRAVV